jgi:hypothetical protein
MISLIPENSLHLMKKKTIIMSHVFLMNNTGWQKKELISQS